MYKIFGNLSPSIPGFSNRHCRRTVPPAKQTVDFCLHFYLIIFGYRSNRTFWACGRHVTSNNKVRLFFVPTNVSSDPSLRQNNVCLAKCSIYIFITLLTTSPRPLTTYLILPREGTNILLKVHSNRRFMTSSEEKRKII